MNVKCKKFSSAGWLKQFVKSLEGSKQFKHDLNNIMKDKTSERKKSEHKINWLNRVLRAISKGK